MCIYIYIGELEYIYMSQEKFRVDINQVLRFNMNLERDPLVLGRVIGDVLDRFTRSVTLRVTYGSRDMGNGREFKPSQVVNQPRVEVGGTDLRNLYTLVRIRDSVHAYPCKSTQVMFV